MQDPLREFVFIDPRASGIGQFHQDVDQRRLRNGLLATLEAVLHEVGVDLNTAPAEMLALVPGLTERAARRVVEHREKIGGFRKREQLKDVSGLSDRVYEQAAGFTRVRGGENPLDDTGLHPLAGPAMEKILASAGVSAAEALENPEALDAVPLEELQDRKFPAAVLRHLVGQMRHSARYPRAPFVPPKTPVELRRASELPIGGKVEGVVSNVADFGVFVDIGAEQDGLLHLSRLSGDVAKDPKTAMKPGDRIEVYVEAVERDGKRISLSMRAPAARQSERSKQLRERRDRRLGDRRPGDRRPGDAPRGRRKQPRRETTIAKRLFGPDEKAKAREEKELRNLSMNEKLALLQSKYQTKV
ncbi:MAG: helix-hairpin-helix domain-containing protein [Proteobacteria bacterium]|nr:helix-hairpin-helix domain-containing protein [Pseudomonadota bacterium]